MHMGSILFLLLLLIAAESQSQTRSISGSDGGDEPLRVFIDCEHCDFNYVRNTLNFVNYVRDPQEAQIHILITDQETSSGGRKFSLSFMGRLEFLGKDHHLTFISLESYSEDQERRGLTEVIKIGLLNYLIETPMASQIHVSVENMDNGSNHQVGTDPWKNWVFSIDLSGELDSESTQDELKIKGALSADRITEESKFDTDFQVEQELERYQDDDETITSDRLEMELETRWIKSLSQRWSFGLLNRLRHTTYRNISLGVRFSPAVEYNFFPWNESDRRSFTIAYKAGFHSFKYLEETLFDKTNEFLFFQALDFELDLIQPWGKIETSIEGSHFFHDLSKYKIEFDCDISIRVFKGLSVTLDIKAENIHDQLYLPKGEASRDEILLQKKQLATDYELSFSLGLRYTFGSIYNNIVNRRL
jgi:hypothetical protein